MQAPRVFADKNLTNNYILYLRSLPRVKFSSRVSPFERSKQLRGSKMLEMHNLQHKRHEKLLKNFQEEYTKSRLPL